MVDFVSLLGFLKSAGFFDFVLPWLLFFAIFLGLLDKGGFISKEKNINSIIAAVIAFFIIAYTPIGGTAVFYITTFGTSAMILSALLVFVLFIRILGFEPEKILGGEEGGSKKFQTPLVLIILVALTYGVYTNTIGSPLSLNTSLGLSEESWTAILVLVFIGLVIWFVSKGGGDKGYEALGKEYAKAQEKGKQHG